jgi:hypothetical protein
MELTVFLWTVIACILGTVIGLVLMVVVDKAYGVFNG